MVENLFTLLMLVMLQAVLGFDNLLYISLESKRAPLEKQAFVRNMGIGLAMVFRILLLVILYYLVQYTQDPFAQIDLGEYFQATVNVHSLIVLGGGVFILYTAIKEIFHMISLEEGESINNDPKSINGIISMIVIMNVVFSFDSILSAMALTDVLWVMTLAIMIGAALMVLLAKQVAEFLKKNRLYEVLGLFILFVVGIMLLTEGGHLAHITILGEPITPMTKTTFYFVIVVLVLTDIVQGRYQKKLLKEKEAKAESALKSQNKEA